MRERTGYKSAKYTTHAEDKELVLSAIAGSQKSYNTLVRKYKPILYTAAKRRLGQASVEDLEDIVMIVLGHAFVRLYQYNPEKSLFFTWIVACLHNYVNSIPKQKKRIQAKSLDDIYYNDGDSPIEYEIPSHDRFDEAYDTQQGFNLLKTLMKRLPPEIYSVFVLKFFRDLSNEDVAKELGIKKEDIWYKVKRGREILKKYSDLNGIF